MNNVDGGQERIYRADELEAFSNEELESIINTYGPRVDRRFRTLNRVVFSYVGALVICAATTVAFGNKEVVNENMEALANISTYGLVGIALAALYVTSGRRRYERSLVRYGEGLLKHRKTSKEVGGGR